MADTFSFEEAQKPASKTFSFEEASGTPASKPGVAAPEQFKARSHGLLANAVGSISEPITEMATGLAGKVAGDVVGLAGIPLHALGLTGGMDPSQLKQTVQEGLTLHPMTEAGNAVSKYGPQAYLGRAIGGVTEGIGKDIKGDGSNPYLEMAGNAMTEGLQQGIGFLGAKGLPKGVTAPVRSAAERVAAPAISTYRDLTGREIPAAKAAAGESARASVEGAAAQSETLARTEAQHARNMDRVRAHLDDHLAQPRSNSAGESVPNLDQQGNTLRTSMKAAYDSAKEARKTAADIEFQQAKAAAAEKEATGARVDTGDIEKQLQSMKLEAKGIPDLEANIDHMLTSIRGRAAPAVEPPGLIAGKYKQAAPPPPARSPGKSFDQLELARRYLNDIAFSGNLEGYPALVRTRARDIAGKLDNAMQQFVPEFGSYKANYAKASEPLHSLDTRLGKAISGAEGGLHGDAYAKVAAQDLPARMFAKKEGIDLVVDALAGGKTATAEARSAAAKQVDTMVENWILENTKAMTGAEAGKHLAAPQVGATMSAVPKVAERLATRFESRAALEQNSANLKTSAEKASKASADLSENSTKMRQDLENSDILSRQPDAASKQDALKGYLQVLARARSAGLVTPEKYKATLDLVSRANTLEERTARARGIAKKIAGGGVAVFLGKEYFGGNGVQK